MFTCAHCSRDFQPARADARFCSPRCRAAANRSAHARRARGTEQLLARAVAGAQTEALIAIGTEADRLLGRGWRDNA